MSLNVLEHSYLEHVPTIGQRSLCRRNRKKEKKRSGVLIQRIYVNGVKLNFNGKQSFLKMSPYIWNEANDVACVW